MAFEVPPLPYDYDALEPHIDEADDARSTTTSTTRRTWTRRTPRSRARELGGQAGRGRCSPNLDTLPEDKQTRRPQQRAAATRTTRSSGRS